MARAVIVIGYDSELFLKYNYQKRELFQILFTENKFETLVLSLMKYYLQLFYSP